MRILVYQGQPVLGDLDANLTMVEEGVGAASNMNADVAVFPELFLSGYNLGGRLRDVALSVDGPQIARLCQFAKTVGVAVVVGFPEKDGQDSFNTAVAITADGNVVAKHRKVFLFGDNEKEIFQPGDEFATFEIAGRSCGLAICYDIEFPEVARNLKADGAQVVFVPTANMVPYFDVPTTLVRARALENGLVVVYANLCGTEGDLEYTGQSVIVAPDGKDLARAGQDNTILMADVSPALARNQSQPMSNQLADLQLAGGQF